MEGQKIWTDILGRLKQTVSSSIFKTWFANSYVLEFKKSADKNLLIVAVKNNFQKEQVETRYLDQIESFARTGGTPLEIVFVVAQKQQKEKAGNVPIFSGVPQSLAPQWSKSESLSGDYSFDNFVVGSSNNLAYLAATQVALNLASRYNPLLIYGPTGVGKTHLLQAIGNEVLRSVDNAKILYASCERFTNDYIESIRNKTQQAFRQKYRNVNLLIVDDIQFLAGKESTQDELFYTFSELLLSRRQVVIASDRHPRELGKIKDRLVSRFMGGMTADIGPADFEMKMAILRRRLQVKGWSISDEIAKGIVESSSGIRELDGALLSIVAQLSMSGPNATAEQIRSVIVKTYARGGPKPTEETIIEAVCKHFAIRSADLLGPSRKKRFVIARQILMFLLRSELSVPLEYIGQTLGGRDHSTIIYGVEKVQNLIKSDRNFFDEVLRVKGLFNKES